MRPFKPASRKSAPGIDEELFLRAARAYALKRFPNPDRKGCPPAEEIGSMARRQLSLSDLRGRAEHIATCSQCLSEYLAARESWKRRGRRNIAILATAAGLVIAIVGVTWLKPVAPAPPPTPPPIGEQLRPEVQLQLATLDLRPLDALRGEPGAATPAPVLARENLRLTILLPTGSDEGNYQFEIRDARGSPRVDGAGNAVIRNYIATIETPLDLRPLCPGRFTFAIRRGQESSWRFYPLEVH